MPPRPPQPNPGTNPDPISSVNLTGVPVQDALLLEPYATEIGVAASDLQASLQAIVDAGIVYCDGLTESEKANLDTQLLVMKSNSQISQAVVDNAKKVGEFIRQQVARV